MPTVRIEEIATRDVAHLQQGCDLRDVIARMRNQRLSCLVICDGRRPVGIISERDVVRLCGKMLQGVPQLPSVEELMTKDLITIDERATAAEARTVKRGHRIRRLVVVDSEGFLSGIVTQSDLLHAHALELERERRALEQKVAERTSELAETNRRLERISLLDSLTGIGNRRAMESDLESIHARAERYGHLYALALFDVDSFKAYNDTYGHPEADKVLRVLAETIAGAERRADTAYRYGGEEILVVLPETPIEGAVLWSKRTRDRIESLGIAHAGSSHGVVTVSIGVAACKGKGGELVDWRQLVRDADAALYEAKNAGRNCVAFAGDGGPEVAS